MRKPQPQLQKAARIARLRRAVQQDKLDTVSLANWSEASIAHMMHDVAHETITPHSARIIHSAFSEEGEQS